MFEQRVFRKHAQNLYARSFIGLMDTKAKNLCQRTLFALLPSDPEAERRRPHQRRTA